LEYTTCYKSIDLFNQSNINNVDPMSTIKYISNLLTGCGGRMTAPSGVFIIKAFFSHRGNKLVRLSNELLLKGKAQYS
jgi:hypothetical protein